MTNLLFHVGSVGEISLLPGFSHLNGADARIRNLCGQLYGSFYAVGGNHEIPCQLLLVAARAPLEVVTRFASAPAEGLEYR